jgi:hypothetical protein
LSRDGPSIDGTLLTCQAVASDRPRLRQEVECELADTTPEKVMPYTGEMSASRGNYASVPESDTSNIGLCREKRQRQRQRGDHDWPKQRTMSGQHTIAVSRVFNDPAVPAARRVKPTPVAPRDVATATHCQHDRTPRCDGLLSQL